MRLLSVFVVTVLGLIINDKCRLVAAFNSEFLRDYELINENKFNIHIIEASNQRSKRDLNSINTKNAFLNTYELKFNAYSRLFHLYLVKQTHLLSNQVDIQVKYANGTAKHLDDLYTSNYYVGYVHNEPDSTVLLYYDTHLIENRTLIYAKIDLKYEIYYIEPSPTDPSQFVVYKADSLKTDLFQNGTFNQKFCKSKKLFDSDEKTDDFRASNANNTRNKRDTSPKKTRCNLALVADWKFFKQIGNHSEKLTALYMINIIGSVNNIFTQTKFDENLIDFGFDIKSIIVHAEPNKESGHYNSENNLKNADTVLDLFGEVDWSSYCLAHLFTFEKFDDSVLGLAFVSSPRVYAYGGICSGLMSRKDKKFSSNIGLSSYRSQSDKQFRLLQREAELVTTHEFGHNWGSEHDPRTDRCSPSSFSGGNFVMYAYANQGFDENNNKFSPCSTTAIAEVIKARSSVCFLEKSKSFCGNSRVEEGEECDGGMDTRNGTDRCCNARCKLRANAACSDANHGCCRDCQIASVGHVCFTSKTYSECYNEKSYCNGVSKDCPQRSPKPTNTPCSSYDNGLCNSLGHCLSQCQQHSITYLPCLCTANEDKCVQCCQVHNQCMPLHKMLNYSTSVHYLSDGRPCLEGICNNRKCNVKVKDHVGRFWTIIEKLSVNAALEFIKRNIVGSTIVLSLIVWIPFSCFIHFCIDKRMRAEQKKYYQRMKSSLPQRFPAVVTQTQDRQYYLKRNSID